MYAWDICKNNSRAYMTTIVIENLKRENQNQFLCEFRHQKDRKPI